LKQFSIVPEITTLFPEYYNEASNLFSLQEVVLIRWLELHGQGFDSQFLRISNLEVSLRDGQVLSALIKTYVKSQSIDKILNLSEKCSTEEVLFYKIGM
jgi:hypothetical protein